METLCVTLHFLDDRFHGKGDDGPEWPPSPFRLFQAMLAAASRNGNPADDVFRWLEHLPPPDILAPQGKKAQAYKTYMPNNDSDKKLDRQGRLSEKLIQPTRIPIDCPVHYLWPIQSMDHAIAKETALCARQVSTVGWGIDLVASTGRILSASETNDLIVNYPGNHWKPSAHSSTFLRCPQSGSFADLQEAYHTFLNRFEGDVYCPARKPVEFSEIAYARVGTPQRRIVSFKLLCPADDSERGTSFDQRKALEIAAWVRGAACRASKTGDFPGDSEIVVAGHVPKEEKNGATPQRFSYLPIPSIGHEYADGRVRRFIIAEPYDAGGRYIEWARRTMANAILTDCHKGPQAILQPMSRPDTVIYHYIREAKIFHTITPVILPGYDDMKYSKAEKLLLKAIEQAGFSTEDLEGLYLQKAPFRHGCYAPRSYELPKYLKGRSGMHVRLTWKEPVSGPLVIGAGRHFGLGLFASEEE